MADADVRDATPSDAADIARLQLATWRTAYADLLPPSVVAELDVGAAEARWREAVDGPVTVLVAEEGGQPVGFAAGGPAPAEESASADGSAPPDAGSVALVGTVLVEPRWGRRGHGGRLLVRLAQQLGRDGATRGIAWVAEADQATTSFFRGAGWAPDGTVRTLDAAGRPLRELRFSGPLDLELDLA
ncbi:GNAT family N-acetyltransferase [Saccharopolyspora cebuensis]|uniref:N-acetyltransferase family protein n=1 Tax=Saccharopolyspora cebuensis TaxID=418759 RepID=A0ABV4CKF8_9PSEU